MHSLIVHGLFAVSHAQRCVCQRQTSELTGFEVNLQVLQHSWALQLLMGGCGLPQS